MTPSESDRYYGKYRGVVLNNIDPEQRGRLLVQMSGVDSFPSSWAMPCFPFTGRNMGFWALPQPGAGVWIEFEQGDLDYPIWSGCWFGGSEELPSDALAAPPLLPNVVVQSQTPNAIVISDIPGTGGIVLKTRTGAKIAIDDTGITIDNGLGASIKLLGPTITIETQGVVTVKGTTVTINDGALAIT